MSLILNIDTALETGSVSLSENGKLVDESKNENRDHASWMHPAIDVLLQKNKYSINKLSAIAVSYGPGSYTGLRIGLATAKGLSYALDIPLICIGTLEIMANAALKNTADEILEKVDSLCPMIDARRMEVYYAVFNKELNYLQEPKAVILDQINPVEIVGEKKLLFFGNGSKKLQALLQHPHAFYTDFVFYGASYMSSLSFQYFAENRFSDLALSEPLYIKEFYDSSSHMTNS